MIRNILSVIWGQFLHAYGIERSKEKEIPAGPYCYSPVKFPCKENDWVYEIKPCPYYKAIRRGTEDRAPLNGCAYLGIITNDSVFDDQCKMCSVNDEYRRK